MHMNRVRLNRLPIAVGMSGCMLALLLGALGATRHGAVVAGAVVGLTFFVAAIVLYAKDPILALIGLWFFEVFNAPLSAAFGYSSETGQTIRQADEILVLLFVILTVWRTLRTSVSFPPFAAVLPGAGVAMFGLLGGIMHGVPTNITAVGALLGLKFWIIVVVIFLLPWQTRDLARVYTILTRLGLVVALFGFVDFVTHGAVSRALHTSNYVLEPGTYRSNAVHSIFPTPGEYSFFMSLLFGVTFARFASKYEKSDLILAILFAASAILSLRLKGALSLVAVVAIVGLAQSGGNSRRKLAALLVGALLLAGGYVLEGNVVSQQISTYTAKKASPRARLYSVGEQIASNDFPLGVGFGRFASYPSRIYYSPVYDEYKLSRVWGLSRSYPNFIDDTSWPSVIGETGYGGFAIYVVGLLALIVAIIRRTRAASGEMRWVPLAALCSIAVLLITSLGESALFSWMDTTTVGIVLGLMLAATPGASKRLG